MILDLIVIVIITVLILIFLEGIASTLNAFGRFSKSQIIAERLHTEYDPLLGWINKPNVHIRDMYGSDKYLKTNAQRFRNNQDITTEIPQGKSRWVCTGDSFTLGYGVDNDHTWCSLLASTIRNTETINMGQGGYGVDQAYLWYMRDGVKIEHGAVLFAFITDDIYRMSDDRFLGYPKPRLTVQNGEIINQNFPVPEPHFLDIYLPRYKSLILELSLTGLLKDTRRKIAGDSSESESGLKPLKREQLVDLSLSIFGKTHDFNKENDRAVVFVHLPTQSDISEDPERDSIRMTLKSKAIANDWLYLDLVQELRKLDSEVISELFIQEDLAGFYGSKGHYTEKGNQLIAEKIAKRWPLR